MILLPVQGSFYILSYPLHHEVVEGYISFTHSFVHQSCPSARPASHVRSVAPTVYYNISKLEFLAIFLNL